MFDEQTVVQAAPDQVSSELGDEVVILGLSKSTYYGLNEIGARIWSLIQEPRRVGEVLDALLEEYEVERERCKRDLLDLLAKLSQEGLLRVGLNTFDDY